MIGDLNTFIQYLAALYFTICIDGAFFQRFWSPDYYKLVTDNIGKYKFQQSKTLKDKLNNAIREHADNIEDHSVKRGVFMLIFCVFFLVYNAFEIERTACLDRAEEWFPLCVSTLYAIGIMLMSGFSLKRWRRVVVHSVVLVALYAAVRCVGFVNEDNLPYFCWVARLKIYLVIFLLAPIVYQLYINWLYSQAYVQHLISTLNDEYERYLKTNKAIIDNDKNLVDECYTKVFSDSYFDNKGQDVVVTKFNQAVLDRLISACRPPVPIVLISRWIKIKYNKDNIEIIRNMESKYQFVNVEGIPQNGQTEGHEDNPQYEKYVQDFDKLNSVSLAKFCKEKGLNLESFREYRKKKLKAKT